MFAIVVVKQLEKHLAQNMKITPHIFSVKYFDSVCVGAGAQHHRSMSRKLHPNMFSLLCCV